MDHFVRLIGTMLRISDPIDEDTPLISTGPIDSFDVVTLLDISKATTA